MYCGCREDTLAQAPICRAVTDLRRAAHHHRQQRGLHRAGDRDHRVRPAPQRYDVGIGYGDDIATARRVALEAVSHVEGVLVEPAPDVLLWDLAGSSKNLRVRWWTRPQRPTVVQVRDRVLQAVAEALAAAGIHLPCPTRVVSWHDQTESTDGDRTRQREGWPAGDAPPPARARVEPDPGPPQ